MDYLIAMEELDKQEMHEEHLKSLLFLKNFTF